MPMDITLVTFSQDVFPKAKATKTLWSSWCTIVLVTLFSFWIQSAECIQILPDWDLAVTHGTQVSFISMSNTNVAQDIPIPVPTSSSLTIGGPLSSPGSMSIIQEWEWKRGTLPHFAADSDVERLFFSFLHPETKRFSIIVFDVTSNVTDSFSPQSPTDLIHGMVFHKGSLYWSGSENNTIWKINVTKPKDSWEYEIFYRPPECEIRSLAVDSRSNIFFWINIAIPRSRKIQYYDVATGKSGDVIKQVYNPVSLATDSTHLYWIAKEHTEFSITRVRLSDFRGYETVYSEHYHFPYSVGVICSESIIWTDRSKLRYKKHIYNLDGNVGVFEKEFKTDLKGVITRSSVQNDWSYCTPEITTITATTTTTTTPKVETSTLETSTMSSVSVPKSLEGYKLHQNSSESLSSPPVLVNSVQKETTTVATLVTDRIEELLNKTTILVNVTPSPPVKTPSVIVITTREPTSTSNATAGTTYSTINLSATGTSEIPQAQAANKNSSAHEYYVGTCMDLGFINSTANLTWCPKNSNPCLKEDHCIFVVNEAFYICLRGFKGPLCETHVSAPPPLVHTSDVFYIIACSGLSFLVVILASAVIFLYIKIRRVDTKPRIRRRVIVRDGLRRRNRERGSSVCELIDIENCCNMNECETPCYETHGSNSSASSSKEVVERASWKTDDQRLVGT